MLMAKIKINCLLDDTDLIRVIRDLMDAFASDRIDETGTAPFLSIYNDLIGAGAEIDIESAAVLYKAQFDLTQNFYTPEDKLEEISGEHFARTLGAINKLEDKVTESQTGQRAPARAAADKIARMFTNTLVDTYKITSQMKVMQNALEKAAFTTLKKSKPATARKPLNELLGEILDETALGVPNLSGQMNSMQDLVREWRVEMGKYREGIEDPVLQEQWDKYTEAAISNVYNVFLSNRQAKEIVDQALFKKGFGKQLENGRMVKDWRKLAGGIKSEKDLRENVVEALVEEVGQTNAELISDSLSRTYRELRTRQLDHNTKELTRRNKFKLHQTRTELERMLALYDYGLFDPATQNEYRRLLAKTVGAPVEDIAALGELQKLLADLSYIQKNYNKVGLVDEVGTVAMSHIVNFYAGRKNLLLKLVNGFGNLKSSQNKALLYSGVNALTQNPIGNKLALLVSSIERGVTGRPRLDDNNISKVATAVFKDVATGGVTYGPPGNQFYSGEDLSKLLFNTDVVKRNQGLQVALSVLVGTWALDGIDSQTKYILTQDKLIFNVRKIMVDMRKPTSRAERKQFEKEADRELSAALYGESFEDAKVKARDIIANSNGRLRDTEAFVTRLADDIVKANIINNGLLTAEQYQSAFSAAFFSAGENIGHESSRHNFLAQWLRRSSGGFNEDYKRALKDGDLNMAAFYRLGDIFFSKILFKFMGGASNWLVIGLKGNGLGLATAFWDKKRKLDVSEVTEEDLKDELISYDRFRRDLALGAIGGITTLMAFLLAHASFGDDDETFTDWVMKNKWAKKWVSVAMPMAYTAYIYAKEDKEVDFLLRTFFLDDKYSPLTKLKQIMTAEGYKGRELSIEERRGLAGQAIGQELGELPIGWRVPRDAKDLYKAAVLGIPKEYQEDPTSFLEGYLWMGALYEFGGVDYLKEMGIIEPEAISTIEGVGQKTEDKLNTLPGFKDLSRGEKLDFVVVELRKQFLTVYKGMTKEEKDAFLKSKDFSTVFPEYREYSVPQRKSRLDSMSIGPKKHKLQVKNEKGNMENIFGTEYVLPALIDIGENIRPIE